MNIDKMMLEVDELIRCKDDVVYFVEKFIKIRTLNGVEDLILHPYQIELLNDDRLTAKPSRQIGFSTLAYIKIVHSIIFNSKKVIVFYGTNLTVSKYHVEKIRELLHLCNIPEELKPKFTVNNKTTMRFDNGMSVMGANNIHNLRGYTISELYVDDVDSLEGNIDEFIHYVIPALSASKFSKIWIWGCSYNGNINKVQEYFKDFDSFKHYTLPWYVIPNRTYEWKKQMVLNTSQEMFNVEHLNNG